MSIVFGDPRMPQRFWNKISVSESGCWEWQAAKKSGYGYYKSSGKTGRAHRIAYAILVAPIPDSLVCDHLCENKGCVNPNHIEPVTDRINIMRGPAPSSMNAKKTHCIRGHKFEPGSYYSSQGWRDCKKCKAINDQARKSRKGLQNAS